MLGKALRIIYDQSSNSIPLESLPPEFVFCFDMLGSITPPVIYGGSMGDLNKGSFMLYIAHGVS